MMKKLVIFDLDGTLFDTTGAMTACGNYAMEQLALPLLTPRDYALISGGGVEDFVCSSLAAAGDEKHVHYDAFWRLYQEMNSRLDENANVPYEGVEEVLKTLKEKGILLAVLSNKDQASCTPIVENAFGKGVFVRIVGGREGVPAKPDPTAVFSLLEELGVAPEECLYIGDTQIDMQTGKNAGLETAAALWGYREREVLEAYAPEHLLEKPLEILSLFR